MLYLLVMRHWPLFVLGLVIAVGVFFRVAPLNDRDYWYDEAFTGITVRQPLPEMMDIIAGDVHPPMYYLLLRGWTTIFGDGPLDIRAFSVTLGVATITLAYMVMRKWEPRSYLPALAGALIVAINPFLVNYSQEARMYSLVTFLVLLAVYFLTTQRRVAYAAVIALLFLTHYLGSLLILCLFLWDAARHRWTLSWLVRGYLLPVIAGALWLPTLFAQFLSSTGGLGWIPAFSLTRLPTTIATFLFGAPVGVAGIPPMLGFTLHWLTNDIVIAVSFSITLAILLGVTLKKQWDAPLALTALLAFMPPLLTLALQQIGMHLYVERYLIGSSIFLILFVTLALSRLGQGWLFMGVMSYSLLVAFVQPWPHTADLQRLDTSNLPQTVIFTTSFDFTSGRYYVGEATDAKLYNITNPHENFGAWRLIAGRTITELPTDDHVIITTTPEAFTDTYREIDRSGKFVVLQPK